MFFWLLRYVDDNKQQVRSNYEYFFDPLYDQNNFHCISKGMLIVIVFITMI